MSRQLASTSHSLDCSGVDGQKIGGLLACDRLLSRDDARLRCDLGAVIASDNVGNRLIFFAHGIESPIKCENEKESPKGQMANGKWVRENG
jgi:hypothetical protein